jgi:predicted transcriptional regulator
MAVLDRRVQILFDPAQYEALEQLARSEHRSVAAIVRETVDQRLLSRRTARRAAFDRMIASAREQDQAPMGEWDEVKANFERDHLAGLE